MIIVGSFTGEYEARSCQVILSRYDLFFVGKTAKIGEKKETNNY